MLLVDGELRVLSHVALLWTASEFELCFGVDGWWVRERERERERERGERDWPHKIIALVNHSEETEHIEHLHSNSNQVVRMNKTIRNWVEEE